MEYRELSNGVRMPVIGYGVFQIPPERTERCVRDALEVGYRLIDTAQAYGKRSGRRQGDPRKRDRPGRGLRHQQGMGLEHEL